MINSRPLLSTSALSAIRDSQGQPFFGNPNQYNGSTQTPPTEWNDPGREELFAKIYNLATTRSRNFRVFVTGQSLDKNGNVLSTVTKVYQVFIKPNTESNHWGDLIAAGGRLSTRVLCRSYSLPTQVVVSAAILDEQRPSFADTLLFVKVSKIVTV